MDNTWTRLLPLSGLPHSLCPLIGLKIKLSRLCFLYFFSCLPLMAQEVSLDPSCKLFNQQLNDIKNAAQLPCADGDLNALNQCFQTHFKRKGERMEQTHTGDVKDDLVHLYKSYDNLLTPITAPLQEYDLVVVLGSTFPNMAHRFQTLLDHIKRGLRVKNIVVLGSDRAMDPSMESEKILRHFTHADLLTLPHTQPFLPQTESQAAQAIIDRTQWPQGLSPITVINTHCPAGKKRATTSDTIQTLLQSPHAPQKGTAILFISSQPFALKQAQDIRSVLGDDFPIHLAADDLLLQKYHFSKPFGYKNMNDNMACLLYQTLDNLRTGKTKTCPTLKKEKALPHNDL